MKPKCLAFLPNHIYEFRKGVRQLFMVTAHVQEAQLMADRLLAEEIDFHVHKVSPAKANLFFGHSAFVETVRRVVNKPLCRLSPEEDFILGTLLGYDREQQCRRFLSLSRQERAEREQAA